MRIFMLVGLLAFGSCARSAADYGQSLFHDATLSTAALNPFSCSACHETVLLATQALPGYPMQDVASRGAWWGGNVDTLLDATNQCVTNFMRGRALAPTDEKGRALFVYLTTLSPDPSAPSLPLTVVQNIKDVPSGDPAAGAALWKISCRNCHGDPHTGAGRISDVAVPVPDDSLAQHGTDPKTGARPVVIEKVRHGRFYGIGGNMPLYSVEALSDAQLGQLLGYLEQFGLPPYAGLP